MKRVLAWTAAMTLALAALTWANLRNSPTKRDRIMGTWELVSADYSGQPRAAGTTQVKMISDKRFMWIQYDAAKNKTLESGFGTYVVNGDSYIEHTELLDVNGDASSFVGKDLTFTVHIDGDTMVQTGSVGQLALKETWKRID